MAAKRTTILVVDDDPQVLRLIARTLQAEGYEVISATDGQQALEQVEMREPELILLDIMIPKLSGFEVCEYIRAFSVVPIIVITARGQIQDKARAFELGADDYLTKPFSIIELLARVRAALRRAQWSANENMRTSASKITIGHLQIDFAQQQVTVNNRAVALTPIEYRILAYLVQNAGRIVTHTLLLEHVWGPAYMGEGHLLKVNISRLRNKIEPDPGHPAYIITKTGLGYILPTHPDVPGGKEACGRQVSISSRHASAGFGQST